MYTSKIPCENYAQIEQVAKKVTNKEKSHGISVSSTGDGNMIEKKTHKIKWWNIHYIAAMEKQRSKPILKNRERKRNIGIFC